MSAWFQMLHIAFEVLKNKKALFVMTFLIGFIPAVAIIRSLPQRFQTSALFNFHSDFAKIPASSEFFPEMYDPNEIRSEKEAILLGVLSDDFLQQLSRDHLGEKAAETEWMVQGLRKDIRFVPLSRTTYQLVVNQQSPDVTQKIARTVIQRLEMTLRHERIFRMQSVHSSLTAQLREMTAAGYDQDLTAHREAMRVEIASEVRRLEGLYTADHPRLARLRHQLNTLRVFKKRGELDPLERSQLENWSSLRGVLILRQALLQVAIRMEEAGALSQIKVVKEPDLPKWPMAPKRNVLYVSAFVGSCVLAGVVAVAVCVFKDARIVFPNLTKEWNRFRENVLKIRDGKNDCAS